MRVLITLFCLVTSFAGAIANNIDVSNVVVTGRDLSAGANNVANFTMVKFDITWQNSWRTNYTSNWDAAWIFVKFRRGMTDPTLSGVSSAGTTVTVSSTTGLRVGMPVRVSSGTGAFAAGTVISSITNSTQFVVSTAPSTPLSNATIVCMRIWEHARLNNTGHSEGSIGSAGTLTSALQTPGSAFDRSNNPVVGVLLHRSAVGSGTFTSTGVQLRWNYGANGITDDDSVDVRVFAIEMVYVPQGSFWVGDGTTSDVRGQFRDGASNVPLLISSEGALTLGGTAAGNLANNNASGMASGGIPGIIVDDFNNTTTQTLPATFPKGVNAYYCMKYEVTQGQYRDFLNCLTRQQQANRCATALGVGLTSVTNRYVMSNAATLTSRNGIRCDATIDANAAITFYCDLDGDGVGNESTDGEWIACNYPGWSDACAYLDWAGLRPMTELEYEKACRGNQTAVAGECAWGTTAYTITTGISNSGLSNESATNSSANVATNLLSTVEGPLRAGVFASGSSGREQSGATYYGIMEMSGNVLERTVSVGHANGRAYTGVHGDGTLSTNGHANTANWPTLIGGEITNSNDPSSAAGSGYRGNNWVNDNFLLGLLRVSDRFWANNFGNDSNSRIRGRGFRGVRTAP